MMSGVRKNGSEVLVEVVPQSKRCWSMVSGATGHAEKCACEGVEIRDDCMAFGWTMPYGMAKAFRNAQRARRVAGMVA